MFFNSKSGDLKGSVGRNLSAKISLTILITSIALLAAKAMWYTPPQPIITVTTTSTATSQPMCAGTGQSFNITITEGADGDFEDETMKTLEISLEGTGFSFDENQKPVLDIQAMDGSVTPDVRFENNNLKFNYKFTNASLSTRDYITISGIRVQAAPTASGNATINVAGGAGSIVGLNNSSQKLLATISLKTEAASTIGGVTEMRSETTERFSVPVIAGADEYEWELPAELNNGVAATVTTNDRNIDLTARKVAGDTPVTIKVRGKNTTENCYGASSEHTVTIKPVGVVITPASNMTSFCKNLNTIEPLTDLVLSENIATDFSGTGTLILELSDAANFTLNGTLGLTVMSTPANGTPVDITNSGFSANVNTTNNTLDITYNFTGRETSTETLTISGLKITAEASALASVVTLRPQNVTNLNWYEVYTNSDFARVTMKDIPSLNAVDIDIIPLASNQYRLIVKGITGATNYEWGFAASTAAGMTFDQVGNVTTSPEIVINDGRTNRTNPIAIDVKGTNTCGATIVHKVTLPVVSSAVVIDPQTASGLCVGGNSQGLANITCNETTSGGFATGNVQVELSQPGYELAGTPQAVFIQTTPSSNVSLLTVTVAADKQSFTIENMSPNSSGDNKLVIGGVAVQAVSATASNQEVFLRTTSLSSVGNEINLAQITRLEQPVTPVIISFPTSVCESASEVSFSVAPVSGMTYEWIFPNGFTVTSSPVNDPNVKVNVGTNAIGGKVKVRTVAANGCTSNWQEQDITINQLPGQAVITTDKASPYVEELVTYTAIGVANATGYKWTLLPGLEDENGNSGEVSTMTNTLKVKVTSNNGANAPVILSVKATNDCGEAALAAIKSITAQSSGVEFVPVELTDICASSTVNISPTLKLTEAFAKDFVGDGILTLIPATPGVTLQDNASLVVKIDGNTNLKFSASVASNVLSIHYDFNFNSNNQDKINVLTIENVGLDLNTSNTTLAFNVSSAPTFTPNANKMVFANITSIASVSSSGAVITPSQAILCENAATAYTLTVTGMQGADTYEWGFPGDVSAVYHSGKSVATLTVNNAATDGDITVSVKGINSSANCESTPVTKTITLLTGFDTNNSYQINGATSLCEGNSEIFEVDFIQGATHYEWVLPPDLESTTPDEDGDAGNGKLTTTGRQISVNVKSSFVGPTSNVPLVVRGIKTGCDQIVTADISYPIDIHAAPDIVITGVTNGQTFASNADDIELTASHTGGYFGGQGIVSKIDNGVTKTYFSPKSLTDLGKKTISYTYTSGGCDFTHKIEVTVLEATVTSLIRVQCRDGADIDFSIDVAPDNDRVLYGLMAVGGLESDASDPAEAGELVTTVPGCTSFTSSSIATMLTKTSQNFRFRPSQVSGNSVLIQAVYIYRNTNTTTCRDVKKEGLEEIKVLTVPTAPVINPASTSVICKNKQGVYTISNPNAAYEYSWDIEADIHGVKGGTFNQNINTGTSVKIDWQTEGTRKVTVVAKWVDLTSCASPVTTFDVDVKKSFTVEITGTDAICSSASQNYTATVKDGDGTVVNGLADADFLWTVENNGFSSNRQGKTIPVSWVTQGNGRLLVSVNTPASMGGCTPDNTFDITFTDLSITDEANKTTVCAEKDVEYDLASIADGSDVTWTVTGGTIETNGANSAKTSITGVTGIKVKWQNTSPGKIVITKGSNCYKELNVNVVLKPVLDFNLNNSYCNENVNITLIPTADGTPLNNGQGTFFEATRGNNGEVIEGNPFPSQFNPSSLVTTKSSYSVVYKYEQGNCTYYSDIKPFNIEEPPTADFVIQMAPAIAETQVQDGNETIPRYCSNNANESSMVTLVPQLNGGALQANDNNFSFVIKQANTEVKVLTGITTFSYSLLNGGGDFEIVYTHNGTATNACGAVATKKIKVVAPANLTIQTQNNKSGYCVNNGSLVNLNVLGLPANVPTTPLVPGQSYFMIKRTSGSKYDPSKDFEILMENGQLLETFNPANPMPGELPPDDNASTDVRNQNVGIYEVKYIYAGDATCTSESSVFEITVNPLPKLSFVGLRGEYCSNESDVGFSVLNKETDAGGIVTETRILTELERKNDQGQWVTMNSNNPIDLGVGTHEIRATHVNSNGCENKSETQTVIISAKPSDLKTSVTRIYHENKMNFVTSASNVGTDGNWLWNLNGTVENEQNTVYYLDKNTSERMTYTLNASTGTCDATIIKTFEMAFDIEGQCTGGTTTFTSKSDIRDDKGVYEAKEVVWEIKKDNQLIATLKDSVATYSFQAPGEYWVTMTITTTDDAATYNLIRRVDIFPVIPVTVSQPYTENFERGTGDWIARGTVEKDQTLYDGTCWNLKKPTGENINNQQGTVWITDNGSNAKTRYNNKEQSYVESPCFDISKLSKPMLSFRYWSNTDDGADGVVLLYTIDDGKNWQRVGKESDQIEGWYKSKGILGAPGSSSSTQIAEANEGNQGWSGTDTTWHTARYSLDGVKTLMGAGKMVRFRVAFGSNSDNPADKLFDGFAFDDFKINERNRTLLMEYFINNSVDDAAGKDEQAKNFPQGSSSNEIISLHYHTAFPGKDTINEQNPQDPSGRAFAHGVESSSGHFPWAIIDGKETTSDLQAESPKRFFNQRTLEASPFAIAIDPPVASGRVLSGKVTITALENFEKSVFIHVVIIEPTVELDGKTYYNVVRKMLPDAAGTYRGSAWTAGDSQNIDFNWDAGDLPLKSFRVVAFVEDYNAVLVNGKKEREVFQAGVSDIQVLREQEEQVEHQVTGVTNKVIKSGIKLYPNPVTTLLHLGLGKRQHLKSDAAWEISTVTGQVVRSGLWQQQKRNMSISVRNLAEGIYIFRVFDEAQVFLLRFEKR